MALRKAVSMADWLGQNEAVARVYQMVAAWDGKTEPTVVVQRGDLTAVRMVAPKDEKKEQQWAVE